MILKTAQLPEAKPHLENLGLVDWFDLLARTHVVYGERMAYSGGTPQREGTRLT